jgi:hypothetical protein
MAHTRTSSMITNNTYNRQYSDEYIRSARQMTIDMHIDEQRYSPLITNIADGLQQIQQIEDEQRLIIEQIDRVDSYKKHLQCLLEQLQLANAHDRLLETRSAHVQMHNHDCHSDDDSK